MGDLGASGAAFTCDTDLLLEVRSKHNVKIDIDSRLRVELRYANGDVLGGLDKNCVLEPGGSYVGVCRLESA